MLHSETTYKLIRRSLIGFLAAIVVLAPAILIFSAYLVPPPDSDDRRAVCAARLKALGAALKTYASRKSHRFPDRLSELVPDYIPLPEKLICPADPSPGPASFTLLPAQAQAPGTVIIAFENDSYHGLGLNVLLANGNVEYMMESAFLNRLRELLQLPCREHYTDAAIKIMEDKAGVEENPKSQAPNQEPKCNID